MPSKESNALTEFYQTTKNTTQGQNLPLNISRPVLEELHTLSSEPTDVTYEEVQCPGTVRPAIWCKPVSASPAHAILYFHGGGYFAGSPASYRKMGGHLAKAAGVYILIVDYRLSPESQYPTQLEDSTAAWQWLVSKGFKPEHLALGGDSAGGHLAITTLLKIKQSGGSLPGAVIVFSPLVDLELKGKSYDTNAETDGIITREQSATMLAMWLGQTSPKDAAANPLYADFSGCPPLYVAAGDQEVLLDDSVRLAEVGRSAGVDVKLEVAEGMQHVYTFMAGKAPEADATLKAVGTWLRSKLSVPSN